MQADRFLRVLLDGLEVGVVLVDRSACILEWNPEAERISGLRAADVMGQPIPAGVLVDANLLGGPWRGPCKLRRDDGRRLEVDLRISPVDDDLGVCLGAVGTFRERGRPSATLSIEARTDPLTGLANRRAIQESLTVQSEDQARGGPTFCVILADLDQFKRINDTAGHRAGDQVLCDSAEGLRSSCRALDLVGRYGGDEFLVVLPGATLPAALRIAERLRCSLAIGPITASFGVAESRPGEAIESLLERVDAALNRAKSLGRDRVEVADLTSPAAP